MITQTEILKDVQRNQIGRAVDEGIEKKAIEIARKMLKIGLTKKQVSEATELSIEKI